MMTVNDVSRITGLSVRTLHHYDKIGLLPPAERTEAGYRLYDHVALEKLMQIMLFRMLEFPLSEIRAILDSEDFDRNQALRQHIELLTMKKEHLDNLIALTQGILMRGVAHIPAQVTAGDFEAFDNKALDAYVKRAKAAYGHTAAYREFEEKSKDRTTADNLHLEGEIMGFFARLGEMRALDPSDPSVQQVVADLRAFITAHFYNCTPQIFAYMGQVYGDGGEFTENIDAVGGAGTGAFACQAVQIYCQSLHNDA